MNDEPTEQEIDEIAAAIGKAMAGHVDAACVANVAAEGAAQPWEADGLSLVDWMDTQLRECPPMLQLRLCPSEHVLEQFRFPRSKKKRIRNKWAKRACNFRPAREMYMDAMGNVYVHESMMGRLICELTTPRITPMPPDWPSPVFSDFLNNLMKVCDEGVEMSVGEYARNKKVTGPQGSVE